MLRGSSNALRAKITHRVEKIFRFIGSREVEWRCHRTALRHGKRILGYPTNEPDRGKTIEHSVTSGRDKGMKSK